MTYIIVFPFRFLSSEKYCIFVILTQPFCELCNSVSVFQSTLAKPESRLETLVGSCTAWSMEFSLMAKCRATRLSAEETIPLTRFSARLGQENTFLVLCSLI